MKNRTLKRWISITLTLCMFIEILPSTAFAVFTSAQEEEPVYEMVVPVEEAIYQDTKHEETEVTRSVDTLKRLDSVIQNSAGTVVKLDINSSDFSVEEKRILLGIDAEKPSANTNAAQKNSGLTENEFAAAAALHGSENTFSRELAALRMGRNYDSFTDAEFVDIERLICSGYTYRQARVAIVSAATLGCSIESLCRAKRQEIEQPDDETEQVEAYSSLSVRMGVPYQVVREYAEKNGGQISTLFENFCDDMHEVYPKSTLGNDAVLLKTAMQEEPAVSYTPEEVLEHPFDYQKIENVEYSLSTGNYKYTETDLSIPGINGLDLNVVRVFDSAYSNAQIPMGFSTGDSDDEYTLEVSYDVYVSYDMEFFPVVADATDYDFLDTEMNGRIDTDTAIFTTRVCKQEVNP